MKNNLDQFYTKETISTNCLHILNDVMGNTLNFEDVTFLEPSAGTGSFIKALKDTLKYKEVLAYDLEPKFENIIQQDYLELETSSLKDKNIVVVGNPPFGKKSKLAIDFFNKSAEFASTIAFIIPMQFQKYSVQSKLNKEFKLVSNTVLEEKAFIYNGNDYGVRCVFQIWTKLDTAHEDLRITKRPETKHPDFEMYQHNNTKESLKYFDYDWDFAVHRQGFYDYSLKFFEKEELTTNKQYIFFKAKDDIVLAKLKTLNFEELSKLNTTTPGFGKADVINMYSEVM